MEGISQNCQLILPSTVVTVCTNILNISDPAYLLSVRPACCLFLYSFLLGLLFDPEDDGNIFFRNISCDPPSPSWISLTYTWHGTERNSTSPGFESRLIARISWFHGLLHSPPRIFWYSTSYWVTTGSFHNLSSSLFIEHPLGRLIAQVMRSGICGERNGTVAGFLRVLLFPLPILMQPTAPLSLIIRRYVVSVLPASLNDQLNIQYSALYSLRKRQHRSNCEQYCHLGYDAVQSGRFSSTFWKQYVSPKR
jgi:hypothetical protein